MLVCWPDRCMQKPADNLIKVTVRLPEALMERIKIRAIRERRSVQDLAAAAFEAYLKTPITREES